jgi:hypothetical protein
LCLVLNALALVLSEMSEKLGCLEVWWLGVFIAPTTKTVVGEVCCRRAHRTVRCTTGHCLVRQPRHPTVRVLTVSTVRALSSRGTGHVLFTVRCAFWRCSDSAHADAHCSLLLLQTTVGAVAVAPHDTPDSPVNYSGVAFSETRRWQV